MNKLEENAIEIVKTLNKAGHTAYFAGGCVRDMFLSAYAPTSASATTGKKASADKGKEPKDYDIATDAKPDEVQKLFPKTFAVGKQFGVIVVVADGHNFEATTFRGEEEYKDARRPSKVYWAKPKEDAQRRDFTINGLFYDPIRKKFIDYVGGEKDIKAKILRFIGNAEKRIEEDNLRILRAVRFKNNLGLKYEQETKEALLKLASKIQNVSAERVKDELDKMLANPNRAKSIKELSDLGILKYVLPELETTKGVEQPKEFHDEGDVWEHTLLSIKNLPGDASSTLAWAMLLHDIAKPQTWEYNQEKGRITFYRHTKEGADLAGKICNRFKFSRKEKEEVVWLVKNHLRFKDLPRMKPARQIRFITHPWIANLLEVSKGDSLSSYPKNFELYNYAKKLYNIESKKPKPPKPLLDGNEVMEILNLKPGSAVGKVLKKLEDEQLVGKIKTKKDAEKFVKDLK